VQAVEEVHDIACSELTPLPEGFGVLWIVHSVPFQRSAKVSQALPELLK
jgi:hypothetical protein